MVFSKRIHALLRPLYGALFRQRRPWVIPQAPLMAPRHVHRLFRGRLRLLQRRRGVLAFPGVTPGPGELPWTWVRHRQVQLFAPRPLLHWTERRHELYALSKRRRVRRKRIKRARLARFRAYLKHRRATDPVYAARMDGIEADERWWNRERVRVDLRPEASWQIDYEALSKEN